MFYDDQRAGVGAIHWDSKGDLVLATSVLENEVQTPETIEAVAILRGI